MYTKNAQGLPQPRFDYDQRVQWNESDWEVATGYVVLVRHDCLGNPSPVFLVQPDSGGPAVERSINADQLRPEQNEVTVW
jgi:hypothetical protein